MEELQNAFILQHGFQVRRGVFARGELDQVGIAVTGRKLEKAQTIPRRVQAHGFCVYGNGRSEVHSGRKIAFMKGDGHWLLSILTLRLCPAKL